ncbi:hypothetical protein HanRHA438_Chr08g0335641 [Helianthus annuus]|nr:hypothetical protein HanRHA438_Chr08g0335641 [Helianthus annuus]
MYILEIRVELRFNINFFRKWVRSNIICFHVCLCIRRIFCFEQSGVKLCFPLFS